MNLKTMLWAAGALLMLLAAYATVKRDDADNAAQKNEENHAEEEGGGGRAIIAPEAAKQSGIEVEEAGSRVLRESVPLTGTVILNPNASAEIKARFPGIVRRVERTVGQSVRKGEAVAYVESNDSLQTYAVTSPLSGTVVTQHAHMGDTVVEEAMFSVADLGSVVAEFHVFPKDLPRIRTGQAVEVQSMDGTVTAEGQVMSILPVADSGTQTVRAWILLDNQDGRWRPGMAVQGGAVVSEQDVPLAVRNAAIQTLDDAMVVFVRRQGNAYEARPVRLGRSDGGWTEVTEGLAAGESYVSKNSFVVKADIGKAGAGHEH